MKRPSATVATLLFLLTAACGTTPEGGKGPVPDKGKVEAKLVPLAVKEKDRPLARVMLDINAAQARLQKYRLEGSSKPMRRRIEEIERYLRDVTSRHLPELLDMLAEGNEFHRTILAWAVGWPREEAAIPPLINALRDPSPRVVKAACLGLKELSLPQVPIEPLVEVVGKTSDPGCRSNAVLALAVLAKFRKGNDRLKGHLMSWLDHGDARVRLHSLLGLRHLVGEQDIPALEKLVNDPKPAVRRALALALWHTGSRRAVPPLIELVSRREPNRNVRLFARKALADLAGGTDAGQNEMGWRRLFAEESKKPK